MSLVSGDPRNVNKASSWLEIQEPVYWWSWLEVYPSFPEFMTRLTDPSPGRSTVLLAHPASSLLEVLFPRPLSYHLPLRFIEILFGSLRRDIRVSLYIICGFVRWKDSWWRRLDQNISIAVVFHEYRFSRGTDRGREMRSLQGFCSLLVTLSNAVQAQSVWLLHGNEITSRTHCLKRSAKVSSSPLHAHGTFGIVQQTTT